jgi:hypothetical protein
VFTLLPDVFAETVTSGSRASGKNTGRLQGEGFGVVINIR